MRTRLEAGEFRAVVDRAYRLEAIADADGYVEKGKKTGIFGPQRHLGGFSVGWISGGV